MYWDVGWKRFGRRVLTGGAVSVDNMMMDAGVPLH